jgi:hypothetical protein
VNVKSGYVPRGPSSLEDLRRDGISTCPTEESHGVSSDLLGLPSDVSREKRKDDRVLSLIALHKVESDQKTSFSRRTGWHRDQDDCAHEIRDYQSQENETGLAAR